MLDLQYISSYLFDEIKRKSITIAIRKARLHILESMRGETTLWSGLLPMYLSKETLITAFTGGGREEKHPAAIGLS